MMPNNNYGTELENHREWMKSWCHSVAGAAAAVVASTAVHPFDVAKTLQQVAGYKYAGPYNAIRTVFREEGVKGLYKGLVPSLIGCILCTLSSS